jgi:PAS domain S-box-containing protein
MTMPLPAFAEVIEQAPDAIVLVDSTGTIVYANSRVVRLFGISPVELQGRSVEVLIPERLRAQHTAHRGAYAREPKVRPMGDSRLALAARRADGSEFPVDIHLAPVDSGGNRWTLAVIRDASERHRVLGELRQAKQAAEQIARVKGEFLAMAAHDLSQPEQTLDLVISTIQRSAQPGSDIGQLTALASASLARMRELLKMLIEISRLESGTVHVAVEPIRVVDIFSDLERQFAAAASAKALRFSSDPCAHIVETDPALLRGMLSNLVTNAIRYTPQGEVSVRCIAPPEGGLRLAVSDTGIGIPADELQRIFQDFHRLEDARRTHRDGFGLGLGIVRRLSALLGYSVTVQSTLGSGSTFGVEIPAARVYPPNYAPSERASPAK